MWECAVRLHCYHFEGQRVKCVLCGCTALLPHQARACKLLDVYLEADKDTMMPRGKYGLGRQRASGSWCWALHHTVTNQEYLISACLRLLVSKPSLERPVGISRAQHKSTVSVEAA